MKYENFELLQKSKNNHNTWKDNNIKGSVVLSDHSNDERNKCYGDPRYTDDGILYVCEMPDHLEKLYAFHILYKDNKPWIHIQGGRQISYQIKTIGPKLKRGSTWVSGGVLKSIVSNLGIQPLKLVKKLEEIQNERK